LKQLEKELPSPPCLVPPTLAARRTAVKRFGAFSKCTDPEVVDEKEL